MPSSLVNKTGRVCSNCDQFKNWKEYGIDRAKVNNNGRRSCCRVCDAKAHRINYTRRVAAQKGLTCSRCLKRKPYDSFYNLKRSITGKQSYCKDCSAECSRFYSTMRGLVTVPEGTLEQVVPQAEPVMETIAVTVEEPVTNEETTAPAEVLPEPQPEQEATTTVHVGPVSEQEAVDTFRKVLYARIMYIHDLTVSGMRDRNNSVALAAYLQEIKRFVEGF